MIIYEYEIPDPAHPITIKDQDSFGPTGELIPFIPEKLSIDSVVNRNITKLETHLGTYGMGGPGFFGLCLSEQWLVIAIWGACEWIVVNNRLIEDTFYEKNQRPTPWSVDGIDSLSKIIIGQKIASIEIERTSLRIVLCNKMEIAVEEGPENRPILEGNKQQRIFTEKDDLRRAVFLSPTSEIWV